MEEMISKEFNSSSLRSSITQEVRGVEDEKERQDLAPISVPSIGPLVTLDILNSKEGNKISSRGVSMLGQQVTLKIMESNEGHNLASRGNLMMGQQVALKIIDSNTFTEEHVYNTPEHLVGKSYFFEALGRCLSDVTYGSVIEVLYYIFEHDIKVYDMTGIRSDFIITPINLLYGLKLKMPEHIFTT